MSPRVSYIAISLGLYLLFLIAKMLDLLVSTLRRNGEKQSDQLAYLSEQLGEIRNLLQAVDDRNRPGL